MKSETSLVVSGAAWHDPGTLFSHLAESRGSTGVLGRQSGEPRPRLSREGPCGCWRELRRQVPVLGPDVSTRVHACVHTCVRVHMRVCTHVCVCVPYRSRSLLTPALSRSLSLEVESPPRLDEDTCQGVGGHLSRLLRSPWPQPSQFFGVPSSPAQCSGSPHAPLAQAPPSPCRVGPSSAAPAARPSPRGRLSIYIPTNSVGGFLFLHILSSIYCL